MSAAYVLDWLNLLARGLHVIAGIAWIGASFYFIWLDNHLRNGELWAVHGGGFYHAQKHFPVPPRMPATLHWFKWEAYTTLLSGLFLLAIVYYAQPALYGADALSGLAWLAGGWIVYEVLCRSPLGRNDRALGAVLASLCAIAAYALCHVYPGRAAFLHFGAMLGTIMVLNVFFVIIPGQREMVAAAKAGTAVDPAWGLRGKQRSVHNTYFTLPAVFTMVSNHYAWIFGAAWNWVWLITLSAAGALIRVYFVARHKATPSPWPLVAAAALLAATAYGARPAAVSTPAPSTSRAQSIVAERCATCHAGPSAPKGVPLDRVAELERNAQRIRAQVANRAMPPGNVTGMTDGERGELLAWIDHHGR